MPLAASRCLGSLVALLFSLYDLSATFLLQLQPSAGGLLLIASTPFEQSWIHCQSPQPVVGISDVCLKVVIALHAFRQKYQHAALTIGAICTESTVAVPLSHIQGIIYRDPDAMVVALLKDRPDLARTFDVALTGCMALFSCLEDEVGNLCIALDQDDGLNWKQRPRQPRKRTRWMPF